MTEHLLPRRKLFFEIEPWSEIELFEYSILCCRVGGLGSGEWVVVG